MSDASPSEGLRLSDVALRFEPDAFIFLSREAPARSGGRRDIMDWLSGGSRKADDSE